MKSLALVIGVSILGVCSATPGSPVRPDYRWASAEAVEKWHDMKFGLRIHWGLYSITAIGPESWPLNRDNGHNQSFLQWYWSQGKDWSPKKYDADKWIALMNRAGTKYFDFTTKHHEGFSMYDTNTRVHDCWDFDLAPGAKTVKGIKACGSISFNATSHTKSTAKAVRLLSNVSLAEAKAECAADPSCECFDFYEIDDHGTRCGAPNACAALKMDASTVASDKSNTLYTKTSDTGSLAFSSMESCGRDFTAELVAAARRGGVIPGLYFSNIDWFDADMRIDQWNAVTHTQTNLCSGIDCEPQRYNNSNSTGNSVHRQQWQRFVLRHRAQVLEVLTKYGEICEASFDMDFPAEFDDDITDTFMLARELAPNTLFRGRGMGGKKEDGGYGDYDTPEETFPDKPVPGNWQVIYHGSNFMSYDPDPSHYVNGSFIIWNLIDVVSKGGLMQIGYGPDKDGEFHPLAVKALEETGDWLQVNGEAIYATRAMPLHWNDTRSNFVRYTRAKPAIHTATSGSTVQAALTQMDAEEVAGTIYAVALTVLKGSAITLLGYTKGGGRVDWKSAGTAIEITLPSSSDMSQLKGPGYTFKITGLPASSC